MDSVSKLRADLVELATALSERDHVPVPPRSAVRSTDPDVQALVVRYNELVDALSRRRDIDIPIPDVEAGDEDSDDFDNEDDTDDRGLGPLDVVAAGMDTFILPDQAGLVDERPKPSVDGEAFDHDDENDGRWIEFVVSDFSSSAPGSWPSANGYTMGSGASYTVYAAGHGAAPISWTVGTPTSAYFTPIQTPGLLDRMIVHTFGVVPADLSITFTPTWYIVPDGTTALATARDANLSLTFTSASAKIQRAIATPTAGDLVQRGAGYGVLGLKIDLANSSGGTLDWPFFTVAILLKPLPENITITVTGDGDLAGASPNGVYVEDGSYNGYPAYTDGTWWMWYETGLFYWISAAKGSNTNAWFCSGEIGSYTAAGTATGTPVAALTV